MPTLRFLSVNADTLPVDRDGLSAVIASTGADVACVLGSPIGFRWRTVSAALARRAGLVVVGGGRTAGGCLLISSLGVDVLGARDLRFAGSARRPVAGAAVAAFRAGTSRFTVAAARLSGNSVAKQAQASALEDALRDFAPDGAPTVLSVEGADRPGTSSWHLLGAGRAPLTGGVFVDERITVVATRDVDAPSTGFAPVCVDLAVP